MKLSNILAGVAMAGLATAIGIPQMTRDQRVRDANGLCLSQYKAALSSGVQLPPIQEDTVVHRYLFGGRRESCSANNGAVTWNPSDNILSLYRR